MRTLRWHRAPVRVDRRSRAAVCSGATDGRSERVRARSGAGERTLERWFLTRTIEHHTMGVEMAYLCAQEATDGLLRETYARIGRDQTEQTPVMQSWLKRWYGGKTNASWPQNGRDLLTYLAQPERGFDFDTEMADEFGHTMRRSTKCLQRAQHQELHALCSSQMLHQTVDIADFEMVMERWDERDEQQSERGTTAMGAVPIGVRATIAGEGRFSPYR